MFNWFKRKGRQNSVGSSKDQVEADHERYLKKLRTAAPARLYDMVTTISDNPSLAEQYSNMSKRMDAALVLKYQPSPETSEVLQRVISTDPEYLVRYHATKSLLLIHGYPDRAVNQRIGELAPKLGYKQPAASPEAIEAIQQLIHARPMKPAPDKK